MLYGVIWCYTLVCSVIRCYLMLCDVIRHCVMLYGVIWCYTVLCAVVWYYMVLYSVMRWYTAIICMVDIVMPRFIIIMTILQKGMFRIFATNMYFGEGSYFPDYHLSRGIS